MNKVIPEPLPSASDIYPAYIKALRQFEALDGELESLEAKKVMAAFQEVATQYAATPFGYSKLFVLDRKIFDAETEKALANAKTKSDKRGVNYLINFHPKIKAIRNAYTDGKMLRNQYETSLRQSRIFNPQLENIPVEIATALENQSLSLSHFVDALKVHYALGADIPLIEGSVFWHCYYKEGLYEDEVMESIGYYSSLRAAHLAIFDFILKDSEGLIHTTPWGVFNETEDPADWDKARLSWFAKQTFPDIVEWYKGARKEGFAFILTQQVISPTPHILEPEGLMSLDFSDPY